MGVSPRFAKKPDANAFRLMPQFEKLNRPPHHQPLIDFCMVVSEHMRNQVSPRKLSEFDMRSHCLFFLLVTISADAAHADDWPQYKGPARNDISAETNLLPQWPAGGPPLVWTYMNLGVGLAGPAVVGDTLYTLGGRGETEFLMALDLKSVADQTVSEKWAVPIGPLFDFQGNNWSSGPSATPTVDAGLVYALSGNGQFVCVEAETGQDRWRLDLPKDLQAEVNPIGGGPKKLGWGFTWSPLIDGERLICLPGGPSGTVAALDKKTGQVIWRSKALTDQAAYTSPMLAEIGGARQYVVLTNRGVYGVAAEDGRLLWSHRPASPYSTEVVNSPIVRGDMVYVTIGSGQGCELFQVKRQGDGFQTEQIYNNSNLANHHGNVVLVGDHVYGFGQGRGWVCQDFATGEVAWAERRKLSAGALTCADGHFYCYSEDRGEAVLLAVSTAGWSESGRFTVPRETMLRKPSGKRWTPPVVANGHLFLRDQDLLFCYDVRGAR